MIGPRILPVGRALLACSAIALVALGGAAADSGAASRTGGTLVIGLGHGGTDTLDPTVLSSFSSIEVLRSMCERLYDFGADSRLVPVLASRAPRISKNKLTYTIPLRRGLRFNDGTPFNAEAAAISLNRDRLLPTSMRRSDLSSIATVTTRGSYAVRIHLKTPYSPLREALATHDGIVMSPTQLAKAGSNFGAQPVCVGPFMYASQVPGYSITVVKSPYYYDKAKVHLDKIVYMAEKDSAAAVAALEAGDIQALDSVTPSELTAVRRDKKLRLIERPSLGWSGIFVNIGNKNGVAKLPYQNVGTPLASSPTLRHAFQEAIDRKALVRVVEDGAGVPDCTPIAPLSPEYPSTIHCTPKNAKAAAKLVKQSGYTNPTVHLLASTAGSTPREAQFIQAEEAAVGINVVIDAAENTTVLAREAAGQFDAAIGGLTGTPNIDRNLFEFVHSTGSRNFSGYSNPRLDSILAKARRTSDPDKVKALYGQATRILLADLPIIYLGHDTVYAAISKSVKNLLFYSDIQLRPGRARFG